MRQVTYNDVEVEIVRQIRKWHDVMLKKYGNDSLLSDIDAGDAADLASEIATNVIWTGIEIIGPMEARRKLSEGWEQ